MIESEHQALEILRFLLYDIIVRISILLQLVHTSKALRKQHPQSLIYTAFMTLCALFIPAHPIRFEPDSFSWHQRFFR